MYHNLPDVEEYSILLLCLEQFLFNSPPSVFICDMVVFVNCFGQIYWVCLPIDYLRTFCLLKRLLLLILCHLTLSKHPINPETLILFSNDKSSNVLQIRLYPLLIWR